MKNTLSARIRVLGLSSSLALGLISLPPESVAANPHSDGLVAYYPLNGNARDRGGNRLHGQLVGTTPTEDRHGKRNRALLFDGVSDHINLGNPTEFNFEGDFTLSIWVKFGPDQVERYIVAKYDFHPEGSSTHSYGLGTGGATEPYGFVLGDGPIFEDLVGPTPMGDNQWHAVAFVFQENVALHLYVDGQLVASRPVGEYPPFANDIPLIVGGTFSGQNFAGALDDVRIYDRALSATEIAAQYAEDAPEPPQPPEPPEPEGLIAYYPLDGNARDRSGNHLHGTLSGTTDTTDRFGQEGGALQFDGITDHIDLGNPTEFNFTGSFTLSTWAKLDGDQAGKYIIGKYDFPANPNGSYGLGTAESSEAYGFVWGTGPVYQDIRGPLPLNDGEWHAIAFVYEQENLMHLYVDGNLVATAFATSPPFVNDTPLYIGGIFSGQNFGGALDDVRIFDLALSSAEVAEMYASDLE